MCDVVMHDVKKCQSDLNTGNGEIRDFVDTVRSNEMGTEQILQSHSMKL